MFIKWLNIIMENRSEIEKLKKADEELILHSFAKQKGSKAQFFLKGKDCYVYDENGKKYLVFTSDFFNLALGYSNRRVIGKIRNQLNILSMTTSSNVPQSQLTLKLKRIIPFFGRIFYSTSGSIAVETALKICRQASGKKNIISYLHSYHGSTYEAANTGSVDFTINQCGYELPGHIKVEPPYCFRCPFNKKFPKCKLFCADEIEGIIEANNSIAGLIGEPLNLNTGIVPPEGYWNRIKAICEENDVMLITDEVFTAFGRTGKMFGMDHWDVTPDIMVAGKNLTAGYSPLYITVANVKISKFFDENYFFHGFTFQGHPLACSAALGVLEEIERRNLVNKAKKMGSYLSKKLYKLKKRHAIIGDIRGKGLFYNLEMVRENKKPIDSHTSWYIRKKLYDKGIIVSTDDSHILALAPPLIIKKEEIDDFTEKMDEILERF
jgi:taurine--2-oxoglutarate transaminase